MEKTGVAACCVLAASVAVAVWFILISDEQELTCYKDAASGNIICKPLCEHGQFGLPFMNNCQKWLKCHDIQSSMKIIKPLASGAVKSVFIAEWSDHQVVYNMLLTPKHHADFHHGLKMIASFQPHAQIVQLLGYCKNVFITELHSLGSADEIMRTIETSMPQRNTVSTRFDFCVKYAKVIEFLHNSPLGTRVMCDSNDLYKTLSQFLVGADFQLIVNDVDALPQVNSTSGQLIKCGHRQLFGDFVAPEQLWPYDDRPFSDEEMSGYDEMTDIWKIPDVCEHFLGTHAEADNLRFHLFKIHKQCKAMIPALRPRASEVVAAYSAIKELLEL